MGKGRFSTVLAIVFAIGIVSTAIGVRAGSDDKKVNQQAAAVQDATVEFAMPHPQPVAAVGSPLQSTTHFLAPDEVSIHKGGTVTFIVNGGGHGIAIHPVSKDTTRDDIASQLCQGGANDADRFNRALVCNGTVHTGVFVNGVEVVGTQNLDVKIFDAKGNLIIDPGVNINNSNPRLDDPASSERLLATSGASPGDTGNPAALATNRAGGFLTGSAATIVNGVEVAPFTPGNRIQVRFERTGRYLVICMNRSHSINDHMFGFVNVVDAGEDE